MVYVNNKYYNPQSINNRIAYDLNTLPKYLYTKLSSNTENMIAEDLKSIAESDAESLDITKFWEENRKKWDKISDEDFFKIWLITRNRDTIDQYGHGMFDLIISDTIKQYNIDKVDDIIRNKDKIKEEINEEIKQFREKFEKESEMIQKDVSLFEPVKHTEFVEDNIEYHIELNIPDNNLESLFNIIRVDNNIPFCIFNNYYKIYKDFIPLSDWSIDPLEFEKDFKDVINMKVLNLKENIDVNIDKNYEDILIYKNSENNSIECHITQDKHNRISKKEMIDRISIVISQSLNELNIIQDSIGGIIYFPKQNIDKHIFSDLVLNNNMFSQYLNIDESIKATKDKLYVFFDYGKESELKATITIKARELNDIYIKNKDIEEFPYGESYIRIKISNAKDISAVNKFIDIISKLFTLYNELKEDVIKYYKEFIPNFKEQIIRKKIPKKDITLSHIIPELFVERYSRFCTTPPEIIEDDEVEKYKKEGKQIMKFPKDSDIIKPRNFICLNKKTQYPGLQPNYLSNSDIFPYRPCCFSKDRTNDKYYLNYYNNIPLPKTQKDGNVKTKKFAPFNSYGNLPENLSNLLFYFNPKYKYSRKGVERSKNSIIECLEIATDTEYKKIHEESIEKAKKYIEEKRLELANMDKTHIDLSICRQEFYDKTTEDIKKYIEDTNIYFDPSLFIKLLEEYYDCNIFIFTRDNLYESDDAYLKLPRHIKTYYRFKNSDKQSIIIFEHWGGEADQASYPQCELISQIHQPMHNKPYSQLIFDSKDSISQNMNIFFDKVNKTYNLNILVKPIPIDLGLNQIVPKYQIIDNYGKCRFLGFEYKGNIIYTLIDPIPPSNLQERKYSDISGVDVKIVLDFLAEIKLTPLSQGVYNDKTVEINTKIENYKLSIKVNEAEIINSIPTKSDINIIPEKLSYLNIYNRNKKLAQHICEYMFYHFSIYLNDQPINNQIINQFFENKTIVKPNYEYDDIQVYIDDNKFLLQDDKLILKSDELKKRLYYVLKLKIERNYFDLVSYKNRKTLKNYFTDINDFNQYPDQVILKGKNSIDKWNKSNNMILNLKDYIDPENNDIYFISNQIITQNEVCLAKNVGDNLNEAITICVNWNKNKIFSTKKDSSQNIKFTLYSYKNNKNIKIYNVDGEDKGNIKIVGYKLKNQNNFTSILCF